METITQIQSLETLNLNQKVVITSSKDFYMHLEGKIYSNIPKNLLILDNKIEIEKFKTMNTVEIILEFFLLNNVNRSDVIYLFGDEILTEVVSFAAFIFKRGLNFVNIPTTLLSCLDLCLGEKNILNNGDLESFWPALEVILVENLIKSFNKKNLNQGRGEALKYFLLCPTINFNLVFNKNLYDLIFQCLIFKQNILKRDPSRNSISFCLDLGHSFGNLIKKQYNLPHGICIIYGIYYEHYILNSFDVVSDETLNLIHDCLIKLKLPKINLKKCDFNLLKEDKKIWNDQIIIPYILKPGKYHFISCDIDQIVAKIYQIL